MADGQMEFVPALPFIMNISHKAFHIVFQRHRTEEQVIMMIMHDDDDEKRPVRLLFWPPFLLSESEFLDIPSGVWAMNRFSKMVLDLRPTRPVSGRWRLSAEATLTFLFPPPSLLRLPDPFTYSPSRDREAASLSGSGSLIVVVRGFFFLRFWKRYFS